MGLAMMVQRKRDIEEARHARGISDSSDQVGDPGDEFIKTRQSDRSRWYAGTAILEKYAILWIPLSAIVGAFGFGWYTPKQRMDEVKTVLIERIDSNFVKQQRELEDLRQRNRALEATHTELVQISSLLVRIACLDPRYSVRDKQMTGLLNAQGSCVR